MKNSTLFLLLFFLSQTVSAQKMVEATRMKKCLLVLIDGVPADIIEKLPTPSLDSIAATGGYSRMYVGGEVGSPSESPTISAVGYNSMLTGTWANKHHVYGNEIKLPNYTYPSIFRAIKTALPEATLGIFSTWEDNRTKLLGEGKAETDYLTLDYVYDGYENDTVLFPHDKRKNYIRKIDGLVTDKAAEVIKKDAPMLSWVYLEYTDDMGHRYGDSELFYESVLQADSLIGVLKKAVDYREKNFNEDWLLIITTDHGRDAVTGRGHGGQSIRERTTWVCTNKPIKERDSYGIVDIFPTVTEFFKIQLPESVMNALDGKAF